GDSAAVYHLGLDAHIFKHLAGNRPAAPVDYGFVGDIEKVNAKTFEALLEAGMTPVVCAINHDGCGTLLNTNATQLPVE
ncbi:MAG: hypothetical protein IIU16_03815, partial [Bacteroidales bacterium]|nr:hypothetical protein [Bacteroidales bacterium]